MSKKNLSIIVILFIIFSYVQSAYAMIGDESSINNNLVGDIDSEKNREGNLFEPIGLGITANAPMGLAVSGPFAILTAGTGAAIVGLGEIADPKNSIWQNWPMNRWTFNHASPESGWGFSSMAEKGASNAVDAIANIIFFITKSITRISINICVVSFHTDIVSGMVGWISEGVKKIFQADTDLTYLLISWGSIFLMIYSVYWILKRELMSVVSALIIAVLAIGSVFFFTANAEKVITDFSQATDGITGVFLGAVGEYTNANQDINATDPIDKGLIAFGQSVWSVIVADPWAIAMFGTCDENDLKLTESECNLMDKSNFPDKSKVVAGMRIDTLYLATTGKCNDDVVEVLARPDVTTFKSIITLQGTEQIKHGKHNGTMVGMAASSPTDHVTTALFTLLPAIGLLLFTGTIGLYIILSQVIMAAMLLVLPFFLFALMIPVQGWAISSKYFKYLLGAFMVKMIYGLYLSLVLSVGTAFVEAVLK
ncbi:hypothetical protein Dtox_2507 [Desulfofarcimen acetoxidans DSM 771]|uniref:Uncharacterized protein n=1 Tax=Desulfofarcimen acetoxidans (strain ATCC 49208 / DSM 771 / KCTC 5769 / VKM B-1644 / 5575) TaxID=485916 RepID=C8W0Q7_DESAS|nr:hypothetical protein [Desulfofarcimen acetoxidans]ACV63312.1 hypothetical protein Dtox_2507 [Desulfofarcimen acetoxidans DSM 771]